MFIAAERGALSLREWLSSHAEESFAISAVTASELLHGVHRAPPGKRREQRRAFVEALLSTYPVHDFDLEAAALHAELWADLEAKGKRIGAHDLLIAATALSKGFGVATLNAKEFRRVDGLEVVVPEVP